MVRGGGRQVAAQLAPSLAGGRRWPSAPGRRRPPWPHSLNLPLVTAISFAAPPQLLSWPPSPMPSRICEGDGYAPNGRNPPAWTRAIDQRNVIIVIGFDGGAVPPVLSERQGYSPLFRSLPLGRRRHPSGMTSSDSCLHAMSGALLPVSASGCGRWAGKWTGRANGDGPWDSVTPCAKGDHRGDGSGVRRNLTHVISYTYMIYYGGLGRLPGQRESRTVGRYASAGRLHCREPLAARTMIPLSPTLAHQLQRPRNVSASVL